MMVDTINQDNTQTDTQADKEAPAQSADPENRFYGGFTKPDETSINLADGLQSQTPGLDTSVSPLPEDITPPPISEVAPVAPPQVSEVTVPVAPKEPKQISYVNTGEAINWRGVLVISATGLLVTAILGAGLYFGISLTNNKNLEDQQAEYERLQGELTNLKRNPVSLELPQTETPPPPPVEETPVVVPVETPVEAPVAKPDEPISPPSQGNY
jgi:hypothetical protein